LLAVARNNAGAGLNRNRLQK